MTQTDAAAGTRGPLSQGEALGRLRREARKLGGDKAIISITKFARACGVADSTLRGWLKKWADSGEVSFRRLPANSGTEVTILKFPPRPKLRLAASSSRTAGPDGPRTANEGSADPSETAEGSADQTELSRSAGSAEITQKTLGFPQLSGTALIAVADRSAPVKPGRTRKRRKAETEEPLRTASSESFADRSDADVPPSEPRTLSVATPKPGRFDAYILALLGTIALAVSLAQSVLHASDRAHGDMQGLVLLGAAAFVIGLAKATFITAGLRIGFRKAAGVGLFLIGLGCLGFDMASNAGYAGARFETAAALGSASHDARARAEADLSRLRERQRLLDQEAVTARTEKGCGTPQQCRQRGEKLARDAAALVPQIQAAEQTLSGVQVRPAADPASAVLAGLINWPGTQIASEDGVRRGFTVALVLLIELTAAFGFSPLARRRM